MMFAKRQSHRHETVRHMSARLACVVLAAICTALFLPGGPNAALAAELSDGAAASAAAAEPMHADVAAPQASQLSIEEISRRMKVMNNARLAALAGYESQRTYRLQYKGFGGARAAELGVNAQYVAPDKIHLTVVSQSGSKMLCDEALRRLLAGEEEATQAENRTKMALNLDNYKMHVAGFDTIAGEPAYVLEVSPKAPSKFNYRGRVWVSTADFAVMRIKGEPAESPSFWVKRASFESSYKKIGDVWVLQQNVSRSRVRLGGEATLTIDYGNYGVLTTRPLASAVRMASR